MHVPELLQSKSSPSIWVSTTKSKTMLAIDVTWSSTDAQKRFRAVVNLLFFGDPSKFYFA